MKNLRNIKFFISKCLLLLGGTLLKLGEKCRPDRNLALSQWLMKNGDRTYRVEYQLDNTSLVFDVGGYEGQWASDIYSRYCCCIYIFEPVHEFEQYISKRFIKNPNVKVFGFGLANETKIADIHILADSSSLYRTEERTQKKPVQFINVYDFFQQNKINEVHLMKVNIEGGEFDLLEHLIMTGLINRIVNLQVQFHEFVDGSSERMRVIQEKLRETHHLTYQFHFVWENWERNV